jgi:hypothetical protein
MVYMALGEGAGAFSAGSGTRWRRGAAFINRDAEKAVVELEEHAVRSLETRETNVMEEPGSARGPEGCLVSRKVDFQNSVQQIFGRPDAKPPAVHCI